MVVVNCSPARSGCQGAGGSHLGKGKNFQEAVHILREKSKGRAEREIWQYFAVLPPVSAAVGVMGDGSTYAYPIICGPRTRMDAYDAEWAHIPYEVLDIIAPHCQRSRGVNRVAMTSLQTPGTLNGSKCTQSTKERNTCIYPETGHTPIQGIFLKFFQ
jgi:hypothetical protein